MRNGSAGLFAGLFAGMDVTLPAAGFAVGRLDGTGDMTVALGRRHSLALRGDFRGDGLTFLTHLLVTAPPPPPEATGRIPLPLLGNPDFPSPPGADAWSAVHVGVFNQVLQALWRAGLFDGTVDGTALGPGLPAGTSLSVQLRTMPVVTGFDPVMTGLDVGGLDLVVTHPTFPPVCASPPAPASSPRPRSSPTTWCSTASSWTSCASRPGPWLSTRRRSRHCWTSSKGFS